MLDTAAITTTVTHTLRAVALDLRRVSKAEWRFALARAMPRPLCACVLDGEWVTLTTPAPADLAPDEAWAMLRLNAALGEAVRLAGRAAAWELRGEICIGAEAGEPVAGDRLDSRLTHLCEVMEAAVAIVGRSSGGAWESNPTATACSDSNERVLALCTEIGWHASALSSTTVGVPLAGRVVGAQAHIAVSDDGRLQAYVPLTAEPTASHASRIATGLLLLDAAATVKGIKGVRQAANETEVVCLAAACEQPVRSARALERALSALAVGVDLVGREVAALQHEPVALDYLAVRHAWGSPSARITSVSAMEELSCPQPS